MNMVSMSISKKGEIQRYLPLEIRIKMYDVHRLHKEGLTYKEIQEIIYEKYGKRLPISTISRWINGKYTPLTKLNKFNEKPSFEFAYVIGAILGDGWKLFDGKNYRIRLETKDKEFAKEFGKNLAKVLNRKEPYKPFWNESRKRWIVEACSVLLFKFLDRPFEELEPYIEYSKDTASAFLRSLYDGEGSICKRMLMLYNTNKELLNHAKYLLKKYFNIDTTGPYLTRKSGQIIHLPNNRIGKAKKDYYYLYIRVNSLLNFYKYIGFTIKRKRQKLIKAIKR